MSRFGDFMTLNNYYFSIFMIHNESKTNKHIIQGQIRKLEILEKREEK